MIVIMIMEKDCIGRSDRDHVGARDSREWPRGEKRRTLSPRQDHQQEEEEEEEEGNLIT